jgi:hypothetical protein
MGLFYRSQSVIVILERESQSYFEIAWMFARFGRPKNVDVMTLLCSFGIAGD